MRRPVILAAALAVALAGCNKKKPPAPAADSGGPAVAAGPGGGVVIDAWDTGGGKGGGNSTQPPPRVSSGSGAAAPNQAGNLTVTGGQGAIQAPRMAAARAVNNAQLRDLHLSMSQAYLLDNRVPTADDVMREARQNSQLMPLLKEEVVILTGTSQGDGVWAYTQYPQRANEHYVVTQQGVIQMAPDDLRKRLEAQRSPVKMAK